MAMVTDSVVGEASSEEIRIDQDERSELEGETCFAKVPLRRREANRSSTRSRCRPFLGHLAVISRDGIEGLSF